MSDDDVDMFAPSPTPSPTSVGLQPSLTSSLCTPSAPTDFESHPSDNSEKKFGDFSDTDLENVKEQIEISQVRVEFLDEYGNKVAQTRYSDNQEIIQITSSLLRSTETRYNKSAVQRVCNSELLKEDTGSCS